MLVSQNTVLTPQAFHDCRRHECRMFKTSGMITLLSRSDSEFYSQIEISSCINTVEIPSSSSLGHALWSGNMTEAATVLQLHAQHPNWRWNFKEWVEDYSKHADYRGSRFRTDKKYTIFTNLKSRTKLTELSMTNEQLGSVGACLLEPYPHTLSSCCLLCMVLKRMGL